MCLLKTRDGNMINKILCVLKKTSYEHYQLKHDVFEQFDEHRKKLLEEGHKKQKEFEKKFKTLASQLKFSITYIPDTDVKKYSAKDYDLVMTFGGDGTFLNAAQHFSETLMLGINSHHNEDPTQGSIGALTSVNEITLATALNRLKKGDYNIVKWKRLYAKINGEKLPELAINDIYFGALEAYKTTNFEMCWNDQIEAFRGSSGIVFSTGMGSTSWFRNIGGPPFANDLPIFGFIVRDAQLSRRPNYIEGIIDGEHEIILKPMRSNYILSFDSKDHTYELGETDELRIGLSETEPVNVIRFD